MSENKPAPKRLLRNREPLNNNSSSEGVSVLAEVGQPDFWLHTDRPPGVNVDRFFYEEILAPTVQAMRIQFNRD